MALGNAANPIIKDSEPRLNTSKWGTIELDRARARRRRTLAGVFTGGDAARGGSTAIRAAGDGQAAAREIVGDDRRRPRRRSRAMVASGTGIHGRGRHGAADLVARRS